MKLRGWWREWRRCKHPYIYTVDGMCMSCREYVGTGLAEIRAMTNPPPLSRFTEQGP